MKNHETKTWLNKGVAVGKGDARIAFRGEIDALQAECVCACVAAKERSGFVLEGLAEMIKVTGRLMRCEALCENMEFYGVLGYSPEELRRISQNPNKYFGTGYFWPDENASAPMAALNRLRTVIRRCERAAVLAYPQEEDWQLSIITALNRLSSAAYILMLKLKAEEENDHRA
jgi:ethanolamine utilization cobalamin adenosyltransferase